MGSGCNDNFKNNSCTDVVSSDCVKWVGKKYTDFDICVNDSLTEVTTFILDKIKGFLIGKGILLPDLTFEDCLYLEDLLGTDEKNLINVLKTYKKAICDIDARLDDLSFSVEDFMEVKNYALGCISLPASTLCNPALKFQSLIQAIINKICSLNVTHKSLLLSISDVVEEVTGNFLQTSIKSCGGNGIVFSGTGKTSTVTFQALVPPYAPILYTGSLALFDSSGKGLPNTAMCGWFLCNGSYNTPSSNALPQNLAGNLKYIIRFS